MENNVKDWLPDSFEETQELAWFAKHFVGEQSFVLLTWEGCSDQDESYKLYVEKLRGEIQPDDEELISDAARQQSRRPTDEDLTPQEQLAQRASLERVDVLANGAINWDSTRPATTTSTGAAWTRSGSRGPTIRGTTSPPTATSIAGTVARTCWGPSAA